MRMLILTAAAVFSLSAPAHAEEAHSFTHEGAAYDYIVTQKGETKVIAGTRDGKRFRLTVRGDRVRGTLGGQPVSFGLDEVQPLVAPQAETLAAR